MEKVLDKRFKNNRVEYFLKWVDYDDSANTWEPEEHLNCKELITDFEQQENDRKNKKILKLGRKRTLPNSIATRCEKSDTGASGPSKKRRKSFPQTNITVENTDESRESDLTENNHKNDDDENSVSAGKENKVSETTPIAKVVDKIIDATCVPGELMYLIKWQGIEKPDLISAEEANLMCPQIVIKFLVERISWGLKPLV